MGPFLTCKGPEGDKLQGTIIHHIFRIHFGTHYSKFKKIVRAVFAQIAKKCYFGPNLPLLGPKWGRGTFFQKSASYTFHHFWISNFMPNFKNIVSAVFWESASRTDIRTAGQESFYRSFSGKPEAQQWLF